MANLGFVGLDDLMLSLEEIAAIPDEVAEEMLNAGADVVVRAQKASAEAMGVRGDGPDGGTTIESIQKGKVKRKNGSRVIYIYPRGTRARGKGRARNAEVAFVNEYGTGKQVARPFIRTANETSAGEATAAMAAVYDKFLKSKNL